MSTEQVWGHKLSRRQLFKFSAGLGLAAIAPELTVNARTQYLEKTRLASPPLLLPSIENESLIYGTHPHNNDHEYIWETEAHLGSPPQIANFFLYEIGDDQPELFSSMTYVANNGILPKLSWGYEGTLFNKHHFDPSPFIRLIDRCKALDYPILFRPFYEMNSSWARKWWPSCDSPDAFKLGWGRLIELITSRKAFNLLPIFSPNDSVSGYPFNEYYPGNDQVFGVGLDSYNKYSYNPFDIRHYTHPNLSPRAMLGPDIKSLQQLTQFSKPILLTEINSSLDHGKGAWVQGSIEFAAQAGVVGWTIFEWNKAGIAVDEIAWATWFYKDLVQALSRELKKSLYRPKLSPTLENTYQLVEHLQTTTLQNKVSFKTLLQTV